MVDSCHRKARTLINETWQVSLRNPPGFLTSVACSVRGNHPMAEQARDVPQLLQASNRQTFKTFTQQGYSFATSLQNSFFFFIYLFALKIAIFSLDCVLLLHFYAVCSCARKPNLMANFQFIVWFCYQALCQMITEFLKEQAIKHMRKMPVNSTTPSPQQWCYYEQDEGDRHKGGVGSTCLWVKPYVTRLLIPVAV